MLWLLVEALPSPSMPSFNPDSARVQFRQSFAQGAHGVTVYLDKNLPGSPIVTKCGTVNVVRAWTGCEACSGRRWSFVRPRLAEQQVHSETSSS